MHNQTSLSIAKIAVLASLLFVSNSAYAQDAPKKWQHGFGAHALSIPGELTSGIPSRRHLGAVLEYAPRREWDNWRLDVGIGRGIRLRQPTINFAPNSVEIVDYDVKVDAYGSIAVRYKLTDRVSIGAAYSAYRYSLHGHNLDFSQTNEGVHFKLSVKSKNRKEAFVILLGTDSSSLGWRTYL